MGFAFWRMSMFCGDAFHLLADEKVFGVAVISVQSQTRTACLGAHHSRSTNGVTRTRYDTTPQNTTPQNTTKHHKTPHNPTTCNTQHTTRNTHTTCITQHASQHHHNTMPTHNHYQLIYCREQERNGEEWRGMEWSGVETRRYVSSLFYFSSLLFSPPLLFYSKYIKTKREGEVYLDSPPFSNFF
jgi:hypothetical protein